MPVHAYLMKHDPPVDMNGAVLYHCGPVVVKEGRGWKVNAAGPTTSIREEPVSGRRHQAVLASAPSSARAEWVPKTLAALKEPGAVYLTLSEARLSFMPGPLPASTASH
jgi:fumarate hydratase class I